MDTVTLQFVTQRDPISWAIRRLTWSDFSHVDLLLPDGRLVGARWDGVKVRQPDYSKFFHVCRYAAPGSEAVLNHALSQVGKPYDYFAIGNFGLHWSHDWRDQSRWYCSELAAWSFAMAGYPLLNTVDCDRISPRDLLLSPKLTPVRI